MANRGQRSGTRASDKCRRSFRPHKSCSRASFAGPDAGRQASSSQNRRRRRSDRGTPRNLRLPDAQAMARKAGALALRDHLHGLETSGLVAQHCSKAPRRRSLGRCAAATPPGTHRTPPRWVPVSRADLPLRGSQSVRSASAATQTQSDCIADAAAARALSNYRRRMPCSRRGSSRRHLQDRPRCVSSRK